MPLSNAFPLCFKHFFNVFPTFPLWISNVSPMGFQRFPLRVLRSQSYALTGHGMFFRHSPANVKNHQSSQIVYLPAVDKVPRRWYTLVSTRADRVPTPDERHSYAYADFRHIRNTAACASAKAGTAGTLPQTQKPEYDRFCRCRGQYSRNTAAFTSAPCQIPPQTDKGD